MLSRSRGTPLSLYVTVALRRLQLCSCVVDPDSSGARSAPSGRRGEPRWSLWDGGGKTTNGMASSTVSRASACGWRWRRRARECAAGFSGGRSPFPPARDESSACGPEKGPRLGGDGAAALIACADKCAEVRLMEWRPHHATRTSSQQSSSVMEALILAGGSEQLARPTRTGISVFALFCLE